MTTVLLFSWFFSFELLAFSKLYCIIGGDVSNIFIFHYVGVGKTVARYWRRTPQESQKPHWLLLPCFNYITGMVLVTKYSISNLYLKKLNFNHVKRFFVSSGHSLGFQKSCLNSERKQTFCITTFVKLGEIQCFGDHKRVLDNLARKKKH